MEEGFEFIFPSDESNHVIAFYIFLMMWIVLVWNFSFHMTRVMLGEINAVQSSEMPIYALIIREIPWKFLSFPVYHVLPFCHADMKLCTCDSALPSTGNIVI